MKALEGDSEKFEIPTGDLSESIQEQEVMIRTMETRLKIKKDLQKLDDEIFATADERFMKELSNEDKIIELTRRRIALQQILKDNIEEGFIGDVRAKELQLESEKMLNKIIDLQSTVVEPAAQFRAVNSVNAKSDPLARIGGFTGGAETKVMAIQERIAKATETTADNTAGNSVRFR